MQFHLELLKLPKHTSDGVSQHKLYILIQHYFKGGSANPLLAILCSFFSYSREQPAPAACCIHISVVLVGRMQHTGVLCKCVNLD